MPWIIPFIPLITAGAGATIGGLELAQAGTGSPMKAEEAQQQQQRQQAQQQQSAAAAQTQQKAILANLPDAQNQTGGSVNAPGLTDLAAIIAGIPGQANSSPGKSALATFLGQQPGGSGGDNLVSSTYGTLNGSQG